MVNTEEAEREQHISDVKDTLGITREQASNLVEKHDAFVIELSHIADLEASIVMLLTTTIALASHGGMNPYDFMVIVREVLMELSHTPPEEWPVAGEA
tara:strand:- start:13802 stop:14095 length:294 start_codon:yes stop_codon:yes gene_type:complete